MKLEIQPGVGNLRDGEDPSEMDVIISSANVMNLLIFGCHSFLVFSLSGMPP